MKYVFYCSIGISLVLLEGFVALLPCNKRVLGFNPGLGSLFIEFAKNITVTLIGLSNLTLGVNVCA